MDFSWECSCIGRCIWRRSFFRCWWLGL